MWWLGPVAGSTALLLLLPGFANDGIRAPVRAPPSGPRSPAVHVRVTGVSTRIPPSFLGLGVEVSELSSYAHAGAVFDRTLSLLRPGSEQSMPLRVGGYSADEAYWDASQQPAPPGVFEVGDDWVRQLAGLAGRDHLQVSLAVNLAVHSPSMAVDFAQAVSHALAPSGLAGVAVGDEPDLYGREPWFDSERVASTLPSTTGAWTADYSPSSYRQDYLGYAQALDAALPGVPLLGPEVASSAPAWLQVLAGLGSLSPVALTVHRYPMSCRPAHSRLYPRTSLLLAERSSAGLAGGLRGAIAFAHQAGMSLVVSEINSASCAGPPGVTNSFASALWAPDVLFELLHTGVDGVYWHIRADRLNSPFELQAGAIEPLPELYGLAMFAQMLGSGARLVAAQVTSAPGADVKAWATRFPHEARILLINKGPVGASVSVNVGASSGVARIERLLAPSVTSSTDVTLAGRWIGADARWHGHERLTTVRPRAGTYRIRVPGYSAALLSARARQA